uniref:Uncharacterized protein n=1 Tax=Strongyloides stercoralis TaxID=6248 RepID=A0A0K0EMF6_STRER
MFLIHLIIYSILLINLSYITTTLPLENHFQITVEGKINNSDKFNNDEIGIYFMVSKSKKYFGNSRIRLKDEIYKNLNQGIYCQIEWLDKTSNSSNNIVKGVCNIKKDTNFITKECRKNNLENCIFKNVNILLIIPANFKIRKTFSSFNVKIIAIDYIQKKKYEISKKNKYFFITSNELKNDYNYFKDVAQEYGMKT